MPLILDAPDVDIFIIVIVPKISEVVNVRGFAGLPEDPNYCPLVASYPKKLPPLAVAAQSTELNV